MLEPVGGAAPGRLIAVPVGAAGILPALSKENIETARAVRESLLTGGPEAAVRYFHFEVILDVAVGHFQGHGGMATWFRTITEDLID